MDSMLIVALMVMTSLVMGPLLGNESKKVAVASVSKKPIADADDSDAEDADTEEESGEIEDDEEETH